MSAVGHEVSTYEIVNSVLKYQSYIRPSGGGVTISGGEPLLQTKALITLFEEFKSKDIHTTIDTSGMFKLTNDIKKLIDLTDLFLLDIKHIISSKSKELIGFSNELEIEFARYLSEINKPVWIRQVLVPGYTDDEEDLLKLKEFIATLNNIEKVEVLPYHDLGKFKWEDLGVDYPLKDIRTATTEDVDRAKKILRNLAFKIMETVIKSYNNLKTSGGISPLVLFQFFLFQFSLFVCLSLAIAKLSSGTSSVIVEPAAISTLFPTFTGAIKFTFEPTNVLSPIMVLLFLKPS